MRISPLKKFIVVSLISLAAITTLVFIFVIMSRNVSSYRAKLETTVAAITLGEKNFNHATKISDLIKNRDRDLQRIRHIAVDRQHPLPFIEVIEQIGHITGVKIALAVDEKSASQELAFHATLEGDEKNMRTMLALIQQLPYQITIDNIAFQGDASSALNQERRVSPHTTHLLLTMRVKTQ